MDEKAAVHISERFAARFRRVVPLPAPVLADGSRASYKNGVLNVEWPKAAPGRPKALRIRVN